VAQKEAAARTVVPEQLAGMPPELEPLYQAAQKAGPAVMKEWLKRYGPMIQDPRKAWIELEYMIAISHDDPAEGTPYEQTRRLHSHHDSGDRLAFPRRPIGERSGTRRFAGSSAQAISQDNRVRVLRREGGPRAAYQIG